MIDLPVIDRLTGGRLGTHDVPCPECSTLPSRSRHGARRKVLRVWRIESSFATYCCARCGASGWARDRAGPRPDTAKLAAARAEAAEHDREAKVKRLDLARWLWSRRRPIAGTIAATYLRKVRGYGGPLPATLGFLAGRGDHAPAMIAAFGLAHEVEPGQIDITTVAVRGVHLTKLRPDGSGKAGVDADKIMIGYSIGSPIVLGSVNDLGGLVIAEGVEDALSAHEATSLGAWAAGAASRMPALADAVPGYTETVTILVDDDDDGRRHSAELAKRIEARGIEARLIVLNVARRAA